MHFIYTLKLQLLDRLKASIPFMSLYMLLSSFCHALMLKRHK